MHVLMYVLKKLHWRNTVTYYHWNCNFPLNPPVRWLVGRWVLHYCLKMTEKIYLLEYKVFNFFVGGGFKRINLTVKFHILLQTINLHFRSLLKDYLASHLAFPSSKTFAISKFAQFYVYFCRTRSWGSWCKKRPGNCNSFSIRLVQAVSTAAPSA